LSSSKIVTGKEGENLMGEINRARIVSPQRIPSDVVTMNTVVRIRNIDQNRAYTIKLVYPEAADPKKGTSQSLPRLQQPF
jgi:Transcription elongation factor